VKAEHLARRFGGRRQAEKDMREKQNLERKDAPQVEVLL
jgi:hypothetical protein